MYDAFQRGALAAPLQIPMIYGIDAVVVIEDADGNLLDISEIGTGNAIGTFPGSTMILRANARDYANDTSLSEGNVTVYALHELD